MLRVHIARFHPSCLRRQWRGLHGFTRLVLNLGNDPTPYEIVACEKSVGQVLNLSVRFQIAVSKKCAVSCVFKEMKRQCFPTTSKMHETVHVEADRNEHCNCDLSKKDCGVKHSMATKDDSKRTFAAGHFEDSGIELTPHVDRLLAHKSTPVASDLTPPIPFPPVNFHCHLPGNIAECKDEAEPLMGTGSNLSSDVKVNHMAALDKGTSSDANLNDTCSLGHTKEMCKEKHEWKEVPQRESTVGGEELSKDSKHDSFPARYCSAELFSGPKQNILSFSTSPAECCRTSHSMTKSTNAEVIKNKTKLGSHSSPDDKGMGDTHAECYIRSVVEKKSKKKKETVLPAALLSQVVKTVQENIETISMQVVSDAHTASGRPTAEETKDVLRRDASSLEHENVAAKITPDLEANISTEPLFECVKTENVGLSETMKKKARKKKKKSKHKRKTEEGKSENLLDVLPEYIPENDTRDKRKKEDNVYNLSALFSGKLGSGFPAKKRERPNYFFAVQITNPEVKAGFLAVQETVEKACPKMKPAFVSVDSAHLTLVVMHLPDDEAVSRALAAMDEFLSISRPKQDDPCEQQTVEQQEHNEEKAEGADAANCMFNLNIKGLDTFNGSVVFAKVSEGPVLDRLTHTADLLRRCLTDQNIPIDSRPFAAHVTLMKTSKNPGKLKADGIRIIDASLYQAFSDKDFGSSPVSTIQLCSMEKPKTNKYYYIEHEIQFPFPPI